MLSSKEDVNAAACKICENISSLFEEQGVNLTLEEEDQIFDLFESIIDKAAGHPDYAHQH